MIRIKVIKNKYRIWSTITDSYLTPPLSRTGAIKFLQKRIEQRADKEIKDLVTNFPEGWARK